MLLQRKSIGIHREKILQVSIPQAVGAVATLEERLSQIKAIKNVSIPQAVGAVATRRERKTLASEYAFQYRKR